MTVKKVVVAQPNPSAMLMSKQDTKHKGDSMGGERVQITFWVTPEKKQALKDYAAERGVTQTHVLVNALDWALKQD